jgi:peptide/nickel transport system permease protein
LAFKFIWYRLKKDKSAMLGLVLVIFTILVALFANVIAPYDYSAQDLYGRRERPSAEHWFGLDVYGRDMLSRIIVGSRSTLTAGVACVVIAGAIGTILGLVAGYFEGPIGSIIMRLMDLMMAFPVFMLAILIVAILGAGMTNAVIAVSITSIPPFARVIRSQTLYLKNNQFVEASKAMGGGNTWIMYKHILPNAIGPLIVMATTGIAAAIISTAALGFVGLGAQPPNPEWGQMLNEGRGYITSDPLLCLIPG